jgi:N-acetylmuramoyl-L-alanine amidase
MPPPPVVPPLIASAAAAGTPEARFAAFMAGLRLRHFAPGEFLFLGASHAARPPHERNSLPPESFWPAIVPVARLLDTLREEMGAPIRLLSVYRSPAYNAAIGGAKASQHTRFTAADFTCADGRRPEDWAARLRAHRRAGVFHGGIGVYPAKGFVHVDVRGHDVDF